MNSKVDSKAKTFAGFHGEWNLGSPGGWEYQRMIQQIYQPAWQEIKRLTGLSIEIDLENDLFAPSLKLADLLLEKHQQNFAGHEPFIVLVAEEETLSDVIENQRFVDYLRTEKGVAAELAGPRELKAKNGKIMLNNRLVTAIYMDFNTSVLVELEKKHSIKALRQAIADDILVNPRGMEPIGAKGVFEAVTGAWRDKLHQTTVERTPWTRKFYPRSTTGPKGEEISDLIKWTEKNWESLILKPEHGWSGKGIIVCAQEKNIKGGIKKALDKNYYGEYIVQSAVPLPLWSEKMPEIEGGKVVLKTKQTDFRCLITNRGVIGFLARYGGVPTNVGSGGGVQALAVITSGQTPAQATAEINQALAAMDFAQIKKIRQEIDQRAMAMKFIYLNGPIPIGLRPRLISPEQIKALKEYGQNLYQDTLVLEKAWRDGELDDIVHLSQPEREIALSQPRQADSPAMMASDGLFNFGAGAA